VKILAIEPYFGLSHKSFLDGYQRFSAHDVEIWSLPPRKWKWRMRGSAYAFAERARMTPEDFQPDVLLVSDFLNLPDFMALAPKRFRNIPCAVYFHENQITYPLGENAPKTDYHFGWINLATAASSDRVFFNSLYHREAFLGGVADALKHMPDHVPEGLVDSIFHKSKIFPVGTDFEDHKAALERCPRQPSSPPTIVWNHRWEYDKGPDTFFEALFKLMEEGVLFQLVVCGESFKTQPAIFEKAREKLAPTIRHFGYFPKKSDYLECLATCDVIVSAAVHEFFGVSVTEAIYMGCLPVLPRRLSYPEIVPAHLHPFFLYDDDKQLVDFLRSFLQQPPTEYRDELRDQMESYNWKSLAPVFDRELEDVAR
jgi:glycosyltransferase involved in cell wall biosynthesis